MDLKKEFKDVKNELKIAREIQELKHSLAWDIITKLKKYYKISVMINVILTTTLFFMILFLFIK